jgi:hypothetical protein
MSFAREAILKAADHIEKHPELYDFFKHDIPADGQRGCLLGWIGRFAGMPAEVYGAASRNPLEFAARKVGFHDSTSFYGRMHMHGHAGSSWQQGTGWAYNAEDAANALRSLAKDHA